MKLDLNKVISDKELLKKVLRKHQNDKIFDKIQSLMWKKGKLLRGEYLTEGIDY